MDSAYKVMVLVVCATDEDKDKASTILKSVQDQLEEYGSVILISGPSHTVEVMDLHQLAYEFGVADLPTGVRNG